MGRRVLARPDPVASAGNHGIVDHGDRGHRPLARLEGQPASASASPMNSS